MRLFQAAALASALVVLGSVPMAAAAIIQPPPITDIKCWSTYNSEASSCIGSFIAGGMQANRWNFYLDDGTPDGTLKYSLTITGKPAANFDLGAHDWVVDQFFLDGGEMPASVGVRWYMDNFPGYVCIPTFDSGLCGMFDVFPANGTTPSWVAGTDNHNYTLKMSWFTNPDPLSRPSGNVTILQDHIPYGSFDNELFNVQYDPNLPPPDPAASGRGDGFSIFGGFVRPNVIPEPASVLLVGAGLAGLLARRRLRS